MNSLATHIWQLERSPRTRLLAENTNTVAMFTHRFRHRHLRIADSTGFWLRIVSCCMRALMMVACVTARSLILISICAP